MYPDQTEPVRLRRRPGSRRLLLAVAGATGALLATGAVALAGPHRQAASVLTTNVAQPLAPGGVARPGGSLAGNGATAQSLGDSRDRNRRVPQNIRAVLHGTRHQTIAVVDITASGGGKNTVAVRAWHLTPGFHAIHIHSVGSCDPAGAKPFASAGGHFNPTGQPEGMQAGAFPVLRASADGTATAKFVTDGFQIAQLFQPTGTAVVLHALPDNYANVPTRYSTGGMAGPDAETNMTGDAGTRVACGVLTFPMAATPTASPTSSMPTMPMPTMPMPTIDPTTPPSMTPANDGGMNAPPTPMR
jgi:Cu-Zn family superoxide dismutase